MSEGSWDLIEVLASEVSDVALRRRLFDRLQPLIAAPPPGRCGALSPEQRTVLDRPFHRSCELLAGHAGMHQATGFDGPPGMITPPTLIHWSAS